MDVDKFATLCNEMISGFLYNTSLSLVCMQDIAEQMASMLKLAEQMPPTEKKRAIDAIHKLRERTSDVVTRIAEALDAFDGEDNDCQAM